MEAMEEPEGWDSHEEPGCGIQGLGLGASLRERKAKGRGKAPSSSYLSSLGALTGHAAVVRVWRSSASGVVTCTPGIEQPGDCGPAIASHFPSTPVGFQAPSRTGKSRRRSRRRRGKQSQANRSPSNTSGLSGSKSLAGEGKEEGKGEEKGLSGSKSLAGEGKEEGKGEEKGKGKDKGKGQGQGKGQATDQGTGQGTGPDKRKGKGKSSGKGKGKGTEEGKGKDLARSLERLLTPYFQTPELARRPAQAPAPSSTTWRRRKSERKQAKSSGRRNELLEEAYRLAAMNQQFLQSLQALAPASARPPRSARSASESVQLPRQPWRGAHSRPPRSRRSRAASAEPSSMEGGTGPDAGTGGTTHGYAAAAAAAAPPGGGGCGAALGVGPFGHTPRPPIVPPLRLCPALGRSNSCEPAELLQVRRASQSSSPRFESDSAEEHTVLLEDLVPNRGSSHLLDSARRLGQKFFEELLVPKVESTKGWHITLLTSMRGPEEAVGSDRVLAYILYRSSRDGGSLELVQLAVAEEHQGRGLGQKLVRWLVRRARDQGNRSVEVYGLPEILTFFKSLGFRKCGRANQNAPGAVDSGVGKTHLEYECRRLDWQGLNLQSLPSFSKPLF